MENMFALGRSQPSIVRNKCPLRNTSSWGCDCNFYFITAYNVTTHQVSCERPALHRPEQQVGPHARMAACCYQLLLKRNEPWIFGVYLLLGERTVHLIKVISTAPKMQWKGSSLSLTVLDAPWTKNSGPECLLPRKMPWQQGGRHFSVAMQQPGALGLRRAAHPLSARMPRTMKACLLRWEKHCLQQLI